MTTADATATTSAIGAGPLSQMRRPRSKRATMVHAVGSAALSIGVAFTVAAADRADALGSGLLADGRRALR